MPLADLFGGRGPSALSKTLALCVYNMPTMPTISRPHLHVADHIYRLFTAFSYARVNAPPSNPPPHPTPRTPPPYPTPVDFPPYPPPIPAPGGTCVYVCMCCMCVCVCVCVCPLPPGSEAVYCRSCTAHCPRQCGDALQEFHCPLPPGSEAVLCACAE